VYGWNAGAELKSRVSRSAAICFTLGLISFCWHSNINMLQLCTEKHFVIGQRGVFEEIPVSPEDVSFQITDARFLPVVSAYACRIGLVEEIDRLVA
jgi:hypothetical protein